MRDFIPAKRAATPSYSTAAANQGYLQMMEEENKRKQRHAAMKAPIDMYNTYTNLTDHNPISDVLRKSNIGQNSASVQQANKTRMLEDQLLQKQINEVGGGAGGGAASAPPPTPDMAGSGVSAATQTGGTAASQANLTAALRGGTPSSGVPAGMAGKEAFQIAGAPGASEGAAAAAKGASLGSKAIPIAGSVLGAGANYMDEKAKGSDDWRVAGKTLGGAAPGVLMAAGPALAAAGPPGWIGLAGLAAASLYGMLG